MFSLIVFMFLLCPVMRNNSVQREEGKWVVSYDEVRPSEPDVYPDYCQGWVYILTPRTAASIAEAAKYVKFLWIDDAWVTGYIRDHLNISIQVSQISIRFDVFLSSSLLRISSFIGLGVPKSYYSTRQSRTLRCTSRTFCLDRRTETSVWPRRWTGRPPGATWRGATTTSTTRGGPGKTIWGPSNC